MRLHAGANVNFDTSFGVISMSAADGVVINDSSTNTTQAWSSQQITDYAAPISHTHQILEIVNLQTELNNKANISHTHTISEVNNLQNTLDLKLSTTVQDLGNLGESLFDVSNQTLQLRTLKEGTGIDVTESNGIVTITNTQTPGSGGVQIDDLTPTSTTTTY